MSDIENVYDFDSISDGVDYLKDGYIEYAQEVIVGRALPDAYDGLKPVNRRILITLWRDKVTKSNMKSARVAGNVLALHPHGDSSVYQAMVLMTDVNGSLAFPLLKGTGSFGTVGTDDKPAHQRYTEVMLHSNAVNEYFNEMDGVQKIRNFDNTLDEFMQLPVSFPAVLVNSTSGIAVGFRSNIPSFNFLDVCDLVKEYIQKGECETVIYPDFVTGGYCVKDNKEAMKLMRTGTGSIKLRAKYVTDGKKIVITEVPFGKTVQKLATQINNLDINCIKNAYDTNDFDSVSLTVMCSSANRTDEAIYAMLKDTDLQYTYSADITLICEGKPKRMGVWDVIKYWVDKRRSIIKRQLELQYAALTESLAESRAFMTIVNDYDKKMELVNIIAKEGKTAGRDYIRKNFTREQVPEMYISTFVNRSISSYHDGGKYAEIVLNGEKQLEELKHNIDNVDELIVKQMDELKSKYGKAMARRTELTNKDFKFTAEDDAEKELDNTLCYYGLRDGFLSKSSKPLYGDFDFKMTGTASSTLIGFDNRGRLLRVYCQDIPLSNNGLGTYLPRYMNLDETNDYKITWMGVMDGRTLMLLYKDGNVGFVDESEWDDSTRNVKVLSNGISASSAPYLGTVFEDIPEALYVSDEDGRIAWTLTADLKRKNRTAKTRAFDLKKNCLIDSYFETDLLGAVNYVRDYEKYHGKLTDVKNLADVQGDVNAFIELD